MIKPQCSPITGENEGKWSRDHLYGLGQMAAQVTCGTRWGTAGSGENTHAFGMSRREYLPLSHRALRRMGVCSRQLARLGEPPQRGRDRATGQQSSDATGF